MWMNTNLEIDLSGFECIDGNKDWVRYRNNYPDVYVDIEIYREANEILSNMCSRSYDVAEVDGLLAWNPLVSQDSREEMVETIVKLEKVGYTPIKMDVEACVILFTKEDIILYLICHTDGL